jgi:hypothetical protein
VSKEDLPGSLLTTRPEEVAVAKRLRSQIKETVECHNMLNGIGSRVV